MPYVNRIDATRLAELASDPTLKAKAIARRLGMGRATLFFSLGANAELWDIYEKARLRAGYKVGPLPAELRKRRGPLTDDDLKIIAAIAGGARTVAAIAVASQVDPRIFAAHLYNLENEKHEIWSREIGRPPVTHYFLRE